MRILVIDDERAVRRLTTLALQEAGHHTQTAENGQEALDRLTEQHYEAAFLDLRLGSESGLDILPKLLEQDPKLDVIVFTAHATIGSAVEAMRRGAFDYLQKPFKADDLRRVLHQLEKTRQLQGKVAQLQERISEESPRHDFQSAEPAVQAMLQIAFKAAATPATMLILGESGTGKSVLARALHERSDRATQTFMTISCPSLSRELLESEMFGHVKGAFTGAVNDHKGKVFAADGGTLFLDEIGELPLEIQPKLLRLLQEREYERVGENKTLRADVRIVAATNRDLWQCVSEGTFREDLYYRLNVISLRIPPLRERPRDLLRFADSYREFFAALTKKRVKGFSPQALDQLTAYSWPGNLRELRNAIERAVILASGEFLEVPDLPEQVQGVAVEGSQGRAGTLMLGGPVSLKDLEEEHIRRILHRSTNYEEAARILGIDIATLYRKRKKLNLE